MTASNVGGGGAVDTGLVVEEVGVDGESTLNGTVGNDLGLDLVGGGGVSDGAINALVLLEALGVFAR